MKKKPITQLETYNTESRCVRNHPLASNDDFVTNKHSGDKACAKCFDLVFKMLLEDCYVSLEKLRVLALK